MITMVLQYVLSVGIGLVVARWIGKVASLAEEARALYKSQLKEVDYIGLCE